MIFPTEFPRPACISSPVRARLVDYGILVLLFVLVLFLNRPWLAPERSPQESDAPGHLTIALRIFEELHGREGSGIDVANVYPPLTHTVTALFFFLGGVSVETALASLSVFILVFIFSLYGAGNYLSGRAGGLAAAFLGTLSPLYLGFTRTYLIDGPLAAVLALALFLLLKTDGFRNPGYSLLFGIAVALGMLTKWTFLLFILIPVLPLILPIILRSLTSALLALALLVQLSTLLVFFQRAGGVEGMLPPETVYQVYLGTLLQLALNWGLIEAIHWKRETFFEAGETETFRRARNLFGAFLFAMAVFLPWYFYSAPMIMKKIMYESANVFDRSESFISYLFYLAKMYFCAPIFLTTGAFFARRGKMRGERLLMVFSLLVSFTAVFITCPVDARYILPVLPFAAIAGGYWAGELGRGKAALLTFIILFSLAQGTGWRVAGEEGFIRRMDVYRTVIHRMDEPENRRVSWPAEAFSLYTPGAPASGSAGYAQIVNALLTLSEEERGDTAAVIVREVREAWKYDLLLFHCFRKKAPFRLVRIIADEPRAPTSARQVECFVALDFDDETWKSVKTALGLGAGFREEKIPAREGKIHRLLVRKAPGEPTQ